MCFSHSVSVLPSLYVLPCISPHLSTSHVSSHVPYLRLTHSHCECTMYYEVILCHPFSSLITLESTTYQSNHLTTFITSFMSPPCPPSNLWLVGMSEEITIMHVCTSDIHWINQRVFANICHTFPVNLKRHWFSSFTPWTCPSTLLCRFTGSHQQLPQLTPASLPTKFLIFTKDHPSILSFFFQCCANHQWIFCHWHTLNKVAFIWHCFFDALFENSAKFALHVSYSCLIHDAWNDIKVTYILNLK